MTTAVAKFLDGPVAEQFPTYFFEEEKLGWPPPDRLMVIPVDEGLAVAPATKSQPWLAGVLLYRKVREFRLAKPMRNVVRGAAYKFVNELETYKWRFPYIDWEHPIEVILIDNSAGGYFCRICVAKLGLKAADVERLAMSHDDAQAHIIKEHT